MCACTRELLTANRTYYVRTDGNDNNSGLVNDASGAFRTIQRAVNVVSLNLDLANYSCVIQVGAGTYAENVRLWDHVGTTTPVLRGDNTTPANVVIAPASGDALVLDAPGKWSFQGFKITSGNHGIYVGAPAVLAIRNLDFGACAAFQMITNFGGVILVTGNYSISGSAQIHMTTTSSGSVIWLDGQTITLTGTPHFSSAFAWAAAASAISAYNVTYTGSATGARYFVKSNGVIDTNTNSPTYLPGNSLIAPQTGGQYL